MQVHNVRGIECQLLTLKVNGFAVKLFVGCSLSSRLLVFLGPFCEICVEAKNWNRDGNFRVQRLTKVKQFYLLLNENWLVSLYILNWAFISSPK